MKVYIVMSGDTGSCSYDIQQSNCTAVIGVFASLKDARKAYNECKKGIKSNYEPTYRDSEWSDEEFDAYYENEDRTYFSATTRDEEDGSLSCSYVQIEKENVIYGKGRKNVD